jgi:murein L,D-transpeptidase YcbB/YkuD
MGGIVARVVGMILVGWVAVEAASQPVAGAAPGSTPCRHWFDGERPGAALTGAVRALAAAADQGLDPADYDAPGLAIRAATARSDEDRTRAVEVVEAAVRHYLGDLRGGRVSPDRRGLLVDAMPPPPDLDALVLAVATGEDLRIVSASIEPRHPAYARLGGALGRWRARAGAPEPPNVPMAPRVKPGTAWAIEEWDGAPALRARLAWLGDLDARTPGRDLTLADALRRFQERHGLAPDGVPGKQTVAALGVPASRRVKQIELAMERLRWLPTPGRRLVFVELPRAMLWALDLDGSGPDLSMALVVGAAPEHKTPLLASHITGVVFRPYWVPTPRIVHDEILPRERSKPGWLAVHGMEIVASMEEDAPTFAPSEANLAAVAQGRLTVRQRPGAKNDLGLLKFVVPNPSCIGLHGTPHRQLFNRQRRDRSHGCIRLEDPLGLAEWVLRGQDGWDRDRIDAATQLAHSSSVRLREPVDLAVTYATASVDPDGSEHFRDDIYGLDAELELLLTAPRR